MKTYDEEYKKSIVKMKELGKPACEIMREYGIPHSTLDRWLKKYASKDGKTNGKIEISEKEYLRRCEENEILKKAIAIFTPRSGKR